MNKKLKVTFPQNCNGCELCVLEMQRQLETVGLEGSLIRIFRDLDEETGKTVFCLEVDPRINKLDIEKISNICPKSVFEITEEH